MHTGVFFNANEGFIQFNPDLEDRVLLDHPILVNKVHSISDNNILYARKVFENDIQDPTELIVDQNQKILQFDVESFQFDEVKNQQFRYYLEGFEEEYSMWTNRSIKEYTKSYSVLIVDDLVDLIGRESVEETRECVRGGCVLARRS